MTDSPKTIFRVTATMDQDRFEADFDTRAEAAAAFKAIVSRDDLRWAEAWDICGNAATKLWDFTPA